MACQGQQPGEGVAATRGERQRRPAKGQVQAIPGQICALPAAACPRVHRRHVRRVERRAHKPMCRRGRQRGRSGPRNWYATSQCDSQPQEERDSRPGQQDGCQCCPRSSAPHIPCPRTRSRRPHVRDSNRERLQRCCSARTPTQDGDEVGRPGRPGRPGKPGKLDGLGTSGQTFQTPCSRTTLICWLSGRS